MPASDDQVKLNAELSAAIDARQADVVEALLTTAADANGGRLNDQPLLLKAIETDDARIVGLVAARTQYLDTTDSCDFAPITHAIRNKRAAAAHALLDAGAKPFPPGKGEEFALDWAVGNKMYDVITRMLAASGWPDRLYKDEPLIVYATRNNDLDLARACLAAGVNVNRGERAHGFTALHVAARNGAADFIRLLLENGARLDVMANGTQTPFDWAGDDNTLRLLVTEQHMREAARAMTEGTTDAITVNRPMQLRKTTAPAPGRRKP